MTSPVCGNPEAGRSLTDPKPQVRFGPSGTSACSTTWSTGGGLISHGESSFLPTYVGSCTPWSRRERERERELGFLVEYILAPGGYG